jgi:hypothetical protein
MAEYRGADYNTEILPEERKSETERPKRKWEGEDVNPAIRKRIKHMNDPPQCPLVGDVGVITKEIDDWAAKACRDLADLLVGYDVGRTIAALDELKHVKNVAKDAVILN